MLLIMKVWLLHRALKSPVSLSENPLVQLSEHVVPLGDDGGQLPDVSGYGGVGAEQASLIFDSQTPEGDESTPFVQVTVRLPFAT